MEVVNVEELFVKVRQEWGFVKDDKMRNQSGLERIIQVRYECEVIDRHKCNELQIFNQDKHRQKSDSSCSKCKELDNDQPDKNPIHFGCNLSEDIHDWVLEVEDNVHSHCFRRVRIEKTSLCGVGQEETSVEIFITFIGDSEFESQFIRFLLQQTNDVWFREGHSEVNSHLILFTPVSDFKVLERLLNLVNVVIRISPVVFKHLIEVCTITISARQPGHIHRAVEFD